MQKQMIQQTKIASCLLLAFTALTLAGCGNHDQAGTSGGAMTPAQIQENTQKQNDFLKNHPPPTANATPPAANATPGH